MKVLKRIVGWIFVIVGGGTFVSAVFCFSALLFGGLEGIGTASEWLAMAIGFLLYMIIAGWMVKIGWEWRRKDVKKAAPVQQVQKLQQTIQPEQRQTERTEKSVVETVIIPEVLRAYDKMPALLHDPEPYAGYQADYNWLDDFYDRNRDIAAYYLLKEGESLAEAVQQFLNYIKTEKYVHIRITQDDILNHEELLNPQFLEMCRENQIRIVSHIKDYGIIDHCSGTKYMVFVSTWPGSADDAATYGEWYFAPVN